MSNSSQLVASLRTHQGQVRDHNEDFIASWEPDSPEGIQQDGLLYVLADGAGGMHAGDVASSMATEKTVAHYKEHNEESDKGLRLYSAMCAANDALRDLMLSEGTEGRMATTMVSTVIVGNKATIANVGDSRGYHWRNGTLRQVTRDHSLVARLVEEGIITAEEALTHHRRNVIYASLGSDNTPQIELFELTLEVGDQLLMCSDGLTEHVRDHEIAEALSTYAPDEITEKLIALANERGGKDNISVIALQINDVSDTPAIAPITAATGSGRQEKQLLWLYTALLALVQTILMFSAWIWLLADLQ